MHLTIYPALWFDNQALEAFEFYCSVFPNSMILEHNQTVVKASLSNQYFIGINGGPYFLPNPAISFTVICDSREEINALWQKLILGGASIIDLGHYSWNAYYGWVQDQFGYTWQLQLGNGGKTPHSSQFIILWYASEPVFTSPTILSEDFSRISASSIASLPFW